MASVVAGLRFKTIAVTKRCSIKAFVQEKSLTFKKGRGFYQLTKPEVIQDYKEVIVRRKSDGKIVTGDQVRELLAIPKSSKKFQLDLEAVADFDVFVQSTSVNRVLLPHTEFLYEVEEATVSFGLCTGRFSTSEFVLSSFLPFSSTDIPPPLPRPCLTPTYCKHDCTCFMCSSLGSSSAMSFHY